jgi:hypothetical protein
MNDLLQYVDFDIIDESFDSNYLGSKFENYKKLGAKQKGAVSERLLTSILIGLGHNVTDPLNTDHDRIVDGIKTEMKTATIIKDTLDKLSFLQIRPAQDVDTYLMTAVLPNDIESYWVEKKTILDLIEKGEIKPQHGGKAGNSGTFCWYPTLTNLKKVGKKVGSSI